MAPCATLFSSPVGKTTQSLFAGSPQTNPKCRGPHSLSHTDLPVGRSTKACYENHFCPTGTGDPLTGQMADDAVNRRLSAEQANPFLNANTLKYLGDEVRKRQLSFFRDCGQFSGDRGLLGFGETGPFGARLLCFRPFMRTGWFLWKEEKTCFNSNNAKNTLFASPTASNMISRLYIQHDLHLQGKRKKVPAVVCDDIVPV